VLLAGDGWQAVDLADGVEDSLAAGDGQTDHLLAEPPPSVMT